jgi:hypothetical protein
MAAVDQEFAVPRRSGRIDRNQQGEQWRMISDGTRSWRSTLVCAICLVLVSCVSPLRNDGVELDASRAKDIIAVIEVLSTRYFERNGCFGYLIETEDGSQEVLCASAPPFRVRATVVRQLYGPRIGSSVAFKTSSHWGKRPFTDGNLQLVHLQIDEEMIEMPNELQANVGVDVEGELFVPAYPDEISWLPCGTNSLKKPVTVKAPANRFAEEVAGLASPPGRAAQDRIFYVSDGERRYPRYGIPIESLASFLQKKRPPDKGLWCD